MEIEELIEKYLDDNYPIEDDRVILSCMAHEFTYYVERDWDRSTGTIDLKNHYAIDRDIAEIFGVEEKEYFWTWVDERISDYSIILDFLDKAVTYDDRLPGQTTYTERHYANCDGGERCRVYDEYPYWGDEYDDMD